MKVIGVTARDARNLDRTAPPMTLDDFWQSVMVGGGLPLLIPFVVPEDANDPPWHFTLRADFRAPRALPPLPALFAASIEPIVRRFDGFLLTGGEDLEPAMYGASPSPRLGKVNRARDRSEMMLAYETLRQGKPILAICRGLQLLNVLGGGTLVQHLEPEPGGIAHERTGAGVIPSDYWAPQHEIIIEPESLLASWFPRRSRVPVTSFHHQAVDQLAPGLRITARADDGCVEAVELESQTQFVVGIQGHPEVMWSRDHPEWLQPFARLVAAC